MKKHIIIATDMGNTCDGQARVIGTYQTKDDAIKSMNADIANYLDTNKREEDELERDSDMFAIIGDEDDGCKWQILEIDIDNTEDTKADDGCITIGDIRNWMKDDEEYPDWCPKKEYTDMYYFDGQYKACDIEYGKIITDPYCYDYDDREITITLGKVLKLYEGKSDDTPILVNGEHIFMQGDLDDSEEFLFI